MICVNSGRVMINARASLCNALTHYQVLDGGGKYTTENEAWFTTIAYMTFSAGFAQAGFDYVNYKCLCVMGKSGFKELAWKDMHK